MKQDNAIEANERERLVKNIDYVSEYSAKLSHLLSRQYLEDSGLLLGNPQCGEFRYKTDRFAWIRIRQVGLVDGNKNEAYFVAMQNILQSCKIPNIQLLFLIYGKDGDYSMYIGLHGSDSIDNYDLQDAASEIASFAIISWPGLKCELLRRDEYGYAELNPFKEANFENVYALTGIPSRDISSGYSTTMEYLMNGSLSGELAYLVMASPVDIAQIGTAIDICTDWLGKLESAKSLNLSVGEREGTNESTTDSSFDSIFGSVNIGMSIGGSSGKSHGVTEGISHDHSETLASSIINAYAHDAAEQVKSYKKRLEYGKTVGLWNVGCYLFTDVYNQTSHTQARSLLGGGKEPSLEPVRIHNITALVNNPGNIKKLAFTSAPCLLVKENSNSDDSQSFHHPLGEMLDGVSTPVTTAELTSFVNFPLHPVSGISVRKMAAFGRNVTVPSASDSFKLGCLNYLGQRFENRQVALDWNKLASHIFIAGSTGSGKSSTIFKLLDAFRTKGTFLVVEPAKGEYKSVFGGYEDVTVYGTNPQLYNLLSINPFSFPKSILLEEHVDRLTDIFNACWPMYAAMPAVLKESIIRAYRSSGWDIKKSSSKYGIYPTFRDVIRELESYVDSSSYSSDSKGDYKGALGMRLSSLTNGILGRILNGGSIDDEQLFNCNTIIDLSRIGSMETKSLLMGFIVMKLNEFRMTEGKGMNLPLRHLTVLEEAHNLLRRVSLQQSQDSSNVAGKSVELLTNSIAEMRTYGEGFIIADQSPSLLDRAVISNTNTKIIMALPEKTDRDIAGDSIDLTDAQKREIPKLETGTAVVFQQGWEEAVLCSICPFTGSKINNGNDKSDFCNAQTGQSFFSMIYECFTRRIHIDSDSLREACRASSLPGKNKVAVMDYLENNEDIRQEDLSKLLVEAVGMELFNNAGKLSSDLDKWNRQIESGLSSIDDEDLYNHLSSFMYLYICGAFDNSGHPEHFETWKKIYLK